MRHLLLSAALALGVTAPHASAQPVPPGGFGGTPPPGGGSLPDYFVLTHPQAPLRVNVTVRPRVGQVIPPIGPGPVEVERVAPPNSVLRDALTISWAATARCGTGLRTLTIDGPGGARSQSFPPSRRAISGRTNYQSFSLAAVDGVCIAWAQGVLAVCGWPLEPGQAACASQTMFRFDADNPLPGNPPITVGGTCAPNVALAARSYHGRLELTCILGDLF